MLDTQSNWLTTYLIEVKGSKPDVSRYQLSMFWMGLTLGRIFFSLPFVHVHNRIGNTILLSLLCGVLLALWKVKSAPAHWALAAFAGFFAGPNTPSILSIASTHIPPDLRAMVLSTIIGLSLLGSTLGPLLFGISINKAIRLDDLPLVTIALAGLCAFAFWAIPPKDKAC
ncbi:major facilitator superfamily transporter [Ceratobasidium sp. AG-Ba]|nr:major facilitator superfamily transporter [Ceratobasidium sp. AG-Ba]